MSEYILYDLYKKLKEEHDCLESQHNDLTKEFLYLRKRHDILSNVLFKIMGNQLVDGEELIKFWNDKVVNEEIKAQNEIFKK
jgi:hypothetical protein